MRLILIGEMRCFVKVENEWGNRYLDLLLILYVRFCLGFILLYCDGNDFVVWSYRKFVKGLNI